MICPTHKREMPWRQTQYGKRFYCEEPGCQMVAWVNREGRASTPADAELRNLRHRCHQCFDPGWAQRARWGNRRKAYQWLQRFMGMTEEQAHIGLFDKEQCRRLIAELTQEQPA